MKRQRRFFTPEFKLEAASLVFDQGYSISEAHVLVWVDKVTNFIMRQCLLIGLRL